MERRFSRKFLLRNFRRGNEIGEACGGEFLFEDTITYSFVNLFTKEEVIPRTTRVDYKLLAQKPLKARALGVAMN